MIHLPRQSKLNIFSRMKKIAPDKWKHFWVGIGLGIILQAFMFFLLNDHLLLATVLSFVIVFAISYGFELFSKFTGLGHYDFMDAVASTIGGLVGMCMVILIRNFL
jgi:hypothetical protein